MPRQMMVFQLIRNNYMDKKLLHFAMNYYDRRLSSTNVIFSMKT